MLMARSNAIVRPQGAMTMQRSAMTRFFLPAAVAIWMLVAIGTQVGCSHPSEPSSLPSKVGSSPSSEAVVSQSPEARTQQAPEVEQPTADVASIWARLSNARNNPDREWRALSHETQAEVLKSLEVADIKELVETGPDVPSKNTGASGTAPAATVMATGTCKVTQSELEARNVLGMRLWSYFEKINWCYSSGKISSKSRTRWAEVYAPFWAFKGHIGSTESGGVGSSSYRAWTQGSFALCAPYVLCAQNRYPWIELTVFATGTASARKGG
jgi:hypothetical protein